MRTSTSHPLKIDEVSAGAGMGKIGITLCPGEKQKTAHTGEWDRDLFTDLASISHWKATAVVTLLEDHEFNNLSVPDLGEKVKEQNIDWYHLPIKDVSTPSSDFETAWSKAGPELRSRVRAGFNVLVHCKGGLGRAGTIAARLLIELGVEPQKAVDQVRQSRVGAIETQTQLSYVMALKRTLLEEL